MDSNSQALIQLKSELEQVQSSLAKLKEKEALLNAKISKYSGPEHDVAAVEKFEYLTPEGLDSTDITRYSRQLLLPQIGSQGQAKIKAAKVLVVGAGGLGSSALMYLASMGVGEIGIVDFDTVDVSNLHRQIIHNESRQGIFKAKSAEQTIALLNSKTRVIPIIEQLSSHNALSIFKDYDIIVDASDNLPTRYLISDASVLSGKPLVYGSALRLDGQLVVYNHKNGPCYRCLFPTPPKFDPKQSCSEAGVLGVVPGIIGCLQALEVIKIILSLAHPQADPALVSDSASVSASENAPQKYFMTTFSALGSPQFRHIRIRGRQPDCKVCGTAPSIKELIDYPAFCGSSQSDAPVMLNILDNSDPYRVSCPEYSKIRTSNKKHYLLDVRDSAQYNLCSLKGSVHIPYNELHEYVSNELSNKASPTYHTFNDLIGQATEQQLPVYVICRRGNLSQLAVKSLRDYGFHNCYQIDGGLTKWQNDVDPSFPSY